MKTFLAVLGGAFAVLTVGTVVCVVGYAADRVIKFDDKIDLANDRLEVLLKCEGIDEYVK